MSRPVDFQADAPEEVLRPQVLVNGLVVVPEGPVRFLSPAAAARAGGR